MFGQLGGRKSRSRKSRSRTSRSRARKLRGGCSPLPLSPSSFDGASGSPMVASNYAKLPNVFPSNQVGGGASMGFNNTNDVAKFAGSYAPWSSECTAEGIKGRFGNDVGAPMVMGGGGKSSKRRGYSKRHGYSKKKRGGTLLALGGGGKKSWKQRGCSKKRSYSKKKRGGNIVLLG